MALPAASILDPMPVTEGGYTYLRITPNASSGGQIDLAVGGQSTTFETPDSVFNLAESFLSFKLTIANAAKNVATNADALAMIRSIEVRSKTSGMELLRIVDVPSYFHVVPKAMTSMQEFLTLDASAPIGGAQPAGTTHPGLRKNNVATGLGNLYPDGSAITTKYTAVLPYYAGSAANAAPTNIEYKIPLKLFYHTILGLDKDLYFGEPISITINWDTQTRIGWEFTVGADPSAGQTALTPACAVSQHFLYLAVQRRQEVKQVMSNQLKSGGIKMILPWVRMDFRTNSSTGSQTAEATVGGGGNTRDGVKLVRCYYSAFHPTRSGATSVDCNNRLAAKFTDLQSIVDDKTEQAFAPLPVAGGILWMFNSKYYKGSVIQDSGEYHEYFAHIMDFTQEENNPLTALSPLIPNKLVGLDLEREHKLQVTVTPTTAYSAGGGVGALNHMMLLCTQKIMWITNTGVTFANP